MSIFNSIKKELFPEEEKPVPNTLEAMVQSSNSPEAGRARVIVVEPLRMEECNAMVECIRHGLIVIINTERLETEFARRIIDFLTGATRAIDGRSLRINSCTYIFAPADIDVATRRKEKKAEPVQEQPKVNYVHPIIPDEAAHTVTEGLSREDNFARIHEAPAEEPAIEANYSATEAMSEAVPTYTEEAPADEEEATAYAGVETPSYEEPEVSYSEPTYGIEPKEDFGNLEEADDTEESPEGAEASEEELYESYYNSRQSVSDDTLLYGGRKDN